MPSAKPKHGRKLPDPAICRAKPNGFGSYINCLVVDPVSCRYALNFGGVYFCSCPERNEIVARTNGTSHVDWKTLVRMIDRPREVSRG